VRAAARSQRAVFGIIYSQLLPIHGAATNVISAACRYVQLQLLRISLVGLYGWSTSYFVCALWTGLFEVYLGLLFLSSQVVVIDLGSPQGLDVCGLAVVQVRIIVQRPHRHRCLFDSPVAGSYTIIMSLDSVPSYVVMMVA